MSVKLNLGCGSELREGYINVDRNPLDGVDVVHDLNSLPYPFADCTVHEILASHVLEHLDSPFEVMKELHRILIPGGSLIVKVPHFSRGFTHAEHSHGFDITFPLYFNPAFTPSGYVGCRYELEKLELHWLAFFHLYKYLGIGAWKVSVLRLFNAVISFAASLSPSFCSRIWCFWVGGFDEIEMHFICRKGAPDDGN